MGDKEKIKGNCNNNRIDNNIKEFDYFFFVFYWKIYIILRLYMILKVLGKNSLFR